MAQVFHPSTNTISKLSIVAVILALPILGVAGYAYNMTFGIALGVPLDQPVPFSHKHHVGDDGIDCRYCHTSAETSAYAGIPSTEVCMTCHSQIWVDSPLLETIRESYGSGRPVQWTRVHDLPDFVYFNHSIHLKKGVNCVSCHGRVDQMPITMKVKPLSMAWCLECHRDPAKQLRPPERVYDLAWQPPAEDEGMPERLMRQYHVMGRFQMTNCSTCHY